MEVTKETPLSSFGVCEVPGLMIPQPYSDGDEINENEAGVLNQTIVENCRNNLRETVKGIVEKECGGDPTKATKLVQKLVDEYIQRYEFGKRSGGFRTGDPVMAEAMDDARKRIRKAYMDKGVKAADISNKDVTEKARLLIEKNPVLLERARKRVAEREKDTSQVLAGIEI